MSDKCCGTCRFFSMPYPEDERGDCRWVSPIKLPFFLWSTTRPWAISDNCATWEPIQAAVEANEDSP